METPRIFESEYQMALIIWDEEPLTTRELVELCEQRLGWKRTTTYTQLKRLCTRGIMRMEDSVVTSLISREQIQLSESRGFLNRTFSGSMARMVRAFTGGQALTKEEADEIRRLIDEYEEKP
ncbi:MAG: BlaI/MecI/CopY family transcriptional regulator [Clostridia bacterium]|nr:BlaI/MecI/CopY family transcriptional regulator [Clostridia bacterium]